jgi:hypothetical protein
MLELVKEGQTMKKHHLLFFALVVILIPCVANAGGNAVPELDLHAGPVSLTAAVLLAFACITGLLTVKHMTKVRRSRIDSTDKS